MPKLNQQYRPGEVPHAAATKRVREKLATMTNAELRERLIRLGMVDRDGRLTTIYGGTATPVTGSLE